MSAPEETNPPEKKFEREFNFSAYPPDSCFYDRRKRPQRPLAAEADDEPSPTPVGERRVRKERRRRVDPTTFEKQYSDDELEFMNAMQRFKNQSGKTFPSFGDVLNVAHSLGYRRTGSAPLGVPEISPES